MAVTIDILFASLVALAFGVGDWLFVLWLTSLIFCDGLEICSTLEYWYSYEKYMETREWTTRFVHSEDEKKRCARIKYIIPTTVCI